MWLLVLAYLYTEMTTDERAMGTFILPLVVAFQSIPAFNPGVEDRAAVLQGPLFGIHVSSLMFAYASFALACVIGITYVLLFKEIKAKHLGFFYARLPSLQVLDSMNQRAIVIGWVFLTVGLVVGAIWATQAPAYDPRVQAMSLQDPKIFVALVCWAVYSFEVVRRAAHRVGRCSWRSNTIFFNHKTCITIIPTRDRLIKPMIMGKIFFTLVIYCSKVNVFLLTFKTLQI